MWMQRNAGNHAVQRMLLRAPTTTTPVPRNDVELLGAQLKMRQIEFAAFVKEAKQDVNNIRTYFDWVNGVYKRTYGHYDLVLSQARAEAESTQRWVDFLFGVATGVSVGVLAEVTIAARAIELGVELLAEIGAEMAEGGIAALVKPEIQKQEPLKESMPELKQIQSLQTLDQLNTVVLNFSVPGPSIYQDPIVQSERLTADLRVMEAGGQPRMTDMDMRDLWLKLMHFSLKSLQVDAAVQDAKAKFETLRGRYMGKQAPSDQRCEQDIWIPWLAKQDIDTFFAPSLFHEGIRRHLVDIGLAGWDKPGGRLNVKVGTRDGAPWGEPSAGEMLEAQAVCRDLKAAAAAAAPSLPPFWRDVYLIG
jgi:hypothetical protein